MKRLVVCVYWHCAPFDPSKYFSVADKALAQLTELGGRRLTWGADRYAFDFEPTAFDEVVHAAMKIVVDLVNHSVGMALRDLAFHKTSNGALCAGGLALSLAEALAVAAGPGQALVDPEIDVVAKGLRSVRDTPVELRELSLRAATLIPGLSSVHEIFDAAVLPRPQHASNGERTSATPPPPSGLRGPVSHPPRPTPSRLPPRPDGASTKPTSMRPPFGGGRVPHPPRPGSVPPVLVRPSAAPPPLKRSSILPPPAAPSQMAQSQVTPAPAGAMALRGSTPPPPPVRGAGPPRPSEPTFDRNAITDLAEELDASELIDLAPSSKAPPPPIRPSQPPPPPVARAELVSAGIDAAQAAVPEPKGAQSLEEMRAAPATAPVLAGPASGQPSNGKKRKRRRKRRKEARAALEASNSSNGV